MFSTASIASIAALAFTSATNALAYCSQAPAGTSFQIYSNVTGLYGQLGGPCYTWGCAVFFTEEKANATTYYEIKENGNLAIGPESTADPPNDIAGRVAYHWLPSGRQQYVLFGRPKKISSTSSVTTIKCSIIDSPDGDGTCNLDCYTPDFKFDSVLTTNYDEWSLGAGPSDFERIQVKVDF